MPSYSFNNATGVLRAPYLEGDISNISLLSHPDLQHLQTPGSQGHDVMTMNIKDVFIGTTIVRENVSARVYNSMYICGHTDFHGKLIVNDIEVFEFSPERPAIEGIVMVGRRQLAMHNIKIFVEGGGNINFDVQFVTVKL